MRLIVAATIGLFAAGTLHAAPLCRDYKGLFTPCPSGARSEGDKVDAAPRHTTAGAEDGGSIVSDVPGMSQKPTEPSLIRKAKLCRDSKGLFKPC